MNNITEKIIISLCAFFVIAYVGYQAYQYFYSPYKTEIAYEYVVSDSIKTRGIAIRSEEVIEGELGGVAHYLFDDAAKIAKDTNIVEIYNSQSSAQNARKLKEIDNEILLLQEASAPTSTSYVHTDVLMKQISEQLNNIIRMTDSGYIADIDKYKDNLVVLLNRRQIALGKATDFSERISLLDSARKPLMSSLNDFTSIKSVHEGYFVKQVDGFENIINTGNMNNLTISEIEKLMTEKDKLNQSIGKVVTDHNWYFAISVNEEDVKKFKQGAVVYLNFSLTDMDKIPATVYSVKQEENNPKNIVFLKCNYITSSLATMRSANVDIQFKSFTGMRISSSAIRYQGLTEGVYVKNVNKIVFKSISRIYEDVGFVLSANAPKSNALKLFDEVIVEGEDLYDGKLIK